MSRFDTPDGFVTSLIVVLQPAKYKYQTFCLLFWVEKGSAPLEKNEMTSLARNFCLRQNYQEDKGNLME